MYLFSVFRVWEGHFREGTVKGFIILHKYRVPLSNPQLLLKYWTNFHEPYISYSVSIEVVHHVLIFCLDGLRGAFQEGVI